MGPEDAEYQMIIPNWHFAVLRKMLPVIIFSLQPLLLLISFLYMLRTMRKQREMEEIKTDFTNNIPHELKTPIAVAYAANDALLNFEEIDMAELLQTLANTFKFKYPNAEFSINTK